MALFQDISDVQAAALLGGKNMMVADTGTNNPNDYTVYQGNSTNSKDTGNTIIGKGRL